MFQGHARLGVDDIIEKIIDRQYIGIFSSYRQIIDIERNRFRSYQKIIDIKKFDLSPTPTT